MYGILTVNFYNFRQSEPYELMFGIFTVNLDIFRQSEQYELQYWPTLKTSAASALNSLKLCQVSSH